MEGMLENLDRIVEQMADIVVITDQDGRIEYVNTAFEQTTGYSSKEVVGHTPRILKSGEHSPEFYEQLWATVLSGGVFRETFVNRKKSGELYYEEKTITPIRDAQGRITYFVSTGKDISQRVQAYQALERRIQERTVETEQLYAQSRLRSRELEALYRADEQLYRHLRLDQVLQALVDVVIDLLHADKASVQVWDDNRQRLVVRAVRGYSPKMIEVMSNYLPGDGIAGKVFLSGEPIAVEDARDAPPPADSIAEAEGIRSVLSVPITIGGQIFGVFGMDYCQPRHFSEDDKRLFLALAQRAAMAIENARLYEQAEQSATLEERQRLARELHDSVTQLLYSLNLFAEAGRQQVSLGDLNLAARHLGQIGETAQQALKEMRLLVYELRPPVLEQQGLIGALRQRLDSVERRAGVEARLEADEGLHLTGYQEEVLYRIAHEALNNALKHSAATLVTVFLRRRESRLELEIVDNGKGFDPLGQSNGGLGVTGMQERAAQMAGEMKIVSAPGQGTRICVSVPHELNYS